MLITLLLLIGLPNTQTISGNALVAALRGGGCVIVMRHAGPPHKQTANADNVKLERQLDETGRTTATAMGKAIQALKIPIGEVFSSPTYRALETVRLAQLPNSRPQPELGDGGQSMQGASDAQAAWLRNQASHATAGTNIIIVTHMPNIARAFPEWGAVADGEAVVLRPDGKGGDSIVGRIKIDEWPGLR